MSDIVIFEGDSRQVEVRLEGETLWVTQSQMAELFGTSTDNISLHLKNIYQANELDEQATAEDFSVVRQEGARQVNHPFSDGNKRSGAFLFLLYLRQEGMRLTLDENSLTALTLLIAESDPKAKELMVRLVMNLLTTGSGITASEG